MTTAPARDDRSAPRTAPIHHHPSWEPEPEAWRLDTVLAHVGALTDPTTGAITTPIHLSTAFGHPGLHRSTGYDYTRTASPTRDVLQDALARLEGGTAAFALSSGMAAQAASMISSKEPSTMATATAAATAWAPQTPSR